jgi:hypothetical protein
MYPLRSAIPITDREVSPPPAAINTAAIPFFVPWGFVSESISVASADLTRIDSADNEVKGGLTTLQHVRAEVHYYLTNGWT